MPLQPRSFRDCSLYGQHWIPSSRGYAKRFLPAAHVFTRWCERLPGQPLCNASPETALDAIDGCVAINDSSASDTQGNEMAPGLGPQKCKHFGRAMSDEVGDARDVLPRIGQYQALVEIDGQVVASTSKAHMLHDWAHTLSHLSIEEPQWPGERIASGTPPVGSALENGHWLQPGDTLRLAIDGVGEITHHWPA
jgi:2-keto-4-pentenoate hydratase/2-oxohepta-3-ene-1,7-dioic acid hydratase in catechol pathway